MALTNSKKKELAHELDKIRYIEFLESQKSAVEQKSSVKNFNRCINLQRKELEFEQNERDKKETMLIKEAKVKRDEKLANEFRNLKEAEFVELRQRQILRENSVELRDLERKLRAAYGVKELKAQMAQKEALKLQEKIKDMEISQALEKAWSSEKELREKHQQEEVCKKAMYKQDLQDQIIYNEKNKRFLYEEFLREKKMLDEIISRIHDEDERTIQEKMCKMQRTRDEMNAFKVAQSIWRDKQKKELEEENLRIQEYIKKISEDERKRYDEARKEKARQDALIEKISRQIYAEEKQRKEKEEILQEILEEEEKARIEQKFRDEVAKHLAQSAALREAFVQQRAEKAQRLKAEAEADARYKEELLAKIREDERLEQLSEHKKRLKLIQLRKDVEQDMQTRRQKRAEEMQELMRLYDAEQDEIKEKQRVIEAERIKMLQEHAHKLIGYIPKGVLRAEDLPHLRCEVVENYKSLLEHK